jgi:hypothetical protein
MLHLTALKQLKVTSVQLELAASQYSSWRSNPQVRLSAISDPVAGGHQVAGQITVFHAADIGPKNLFRMFRSGLFDASIGVEPGYLHLLWRACTMPYEYFNASLALQNPINFGLDLQEADLAFTYEIGRGKIAWEHFPSEDWIA